jgi:outer membrane receptor protein involved in Fe transport
MRKTILLLLTVFLLQYTLNAQNKIIIEGKIKDSISNRAIEYATITLFDAYTNKTLTGTTTDSLGNFKLTDIDTGTYNLAFEFIGYTKRNQKLQVTADKTIYDLDVITLHKNGNTLQDVVVTSQQKLIETRIDKIIFNAENDVTSQGGVATDILKKVPQVSVDADGNVELAGSSSVRFLIDGKPSTAFGSNVADVLQAIPASQIKSIEVITNPGAKYDAQGLGGIINIILKKSRVNGVNGNVSLTGGTRVENGSFNLTVRKNNFGMNAFVGGNIRLAAATPIALNRVTTDSIAKQNYLLQQQGSPETKRHGGQAGIGFDWTYKKYNNFSGSLRYNRFGNNGEGLINQQQEIIPFNADTVLLNTTSRNTSTGSFLLSSVDAEVGYRRTFAKEDQSFEIFLRTSNGNTSNKGNTYQTLLPQDSILYGIINQNPGTEKESEIEINYSQPLSEKIMFDAGADFTFNDIKSNSDVYAFQPISKDYVYDSLVSNHLLYHQQVYAAYAELSFPVGKLFDAKLGSRYERTEIDSYYSNAEQQSPTPGYNSFVPSIYFLRKLTDNQNLKLSYSKRINRPNYQDLNPFVNTTDPKNITAGNPYLKPEIGNRYELAYNHDYGRAGSFMITAFYRTSKNDIQPYTAVYPALVIGDSTYTNIAVSTRENIGTEQNAGISFFGTIRASDKFNIRTNIFAFRRYIINGIDSGNNPVSYNYRINVNLSYQFSKTLSVEAFGNFSSARNEIQGKYPSFTTYTIAGRKQLWNKKASIAITANNFFNEYLNQKTVLYGTNFISNNVRQIPFRSIGINFTWKFGRLEFKKDKNENGEGNAPEESAS